MKYLKQTGLAVVVAAALGAGLPSVGHAGTIVTYDLNAMGTWTSGQNNYSGTTGTDTFTGTLEYDTSTGMFTGATVTVAGPIAADGVYSCAVSANCNGGPAADPTGLSVQIASGNDLFTLYFTDGFGPAGGTPISYNPSSNGTGFYYSTNGSAPTGADPFTTSVSGGATLTPLPSALALFAGGAGLMGLLTRRRKRKNAAAIAA
jgi:hypothetical protein